MAPLRFPNLQSWQSQEGSPWWFCSYFSLWYFWLLYCFSSIRVICLLISTKASIVFDDTLGYGVLYSVSNSQSPRQILLSFSSWWPALFTGRTPVPLHSAGVRHPLFQSDKHPLSPSVYWRWELWQCLVLAYPLQHGTSTLPASAPGQGGDDPDPRIVIWGQAPTLRASGAGWEREASPFGCTVQRESQRCGTIAWEGGKREPHLLGRIFPEQKAQCSTFVIQSWGAMGKESGCGPNPPTLTILTKV